MPRARSKNAKTRVEMQALVDSLHARIRHRDPDYFAVAEIAGELSRAAKLRADVYEAEFEDRKHGAV